jgi:hypothetical protein
MRPNKIGQVAKIHTRLPEENINQLYVVLEIIEEDERPRTNIKASITSLSYPPNNTAALNDLEVETFDLLKHQVNFKKADYSQATGKVVKVSEQKIMLDLTKGVKGVETNVWLTIQDENGTEHI